MRFRSVSVIRWVYFLFIFCSGYLLIGCSEPMDDEARIRARVAAMAMATEAKALDAAIEPVHEDFLGNKRIRKVNLRGLILWHFQRNKNVHVLVNDIEVELDTKTEPKTARVSCNVVLVGRNQTLPENAKVLRVASLWQKDDGDWFVHSAKWRDPILEMLRR